MEGKHELSKEGKVKMILEEMMPIRGVLEFRGYEDWITTIEYYRNRIMDVFEK